MQTLTADQLDSMMDEDEEFTLINVLGEEDFRRVHIPGSENIPVGRDDFEQAVKELVGSRGSTVVVYCADFDCEASPAAARKLDEAGFTDVYDFEGGVKQWMKAGHEVEGEETAGSRS